MVKIHAKILFSRFYIHVLFRIHESDTKCHKLSNTVYLLFLHQSLAPITLILVCNLEKVRREVEDDRTCIILIVYQTASYNLNVEQRLIGVESPI